MVSRHLLILETRKFHIRKEKKVTIYSLLLYTFNRVKRRREEVRKFLVTDPWASRALRYRLSYVLLGLALSELRTSSDGHQEEILSRETEEKKAFFSSDFGGLCPRTKSTESVKEIHIMQLCGTRTEPKLYTLELFIENNWIFCWCFCFGYSNCISEN